MDTPLNEIATALAKAQAEMSNPAFDAANPHFRNRFASLAAVRNAVVPHLAKHGISLVQDIQSTENGIACYTILTHASGQQMRFGPLTLPASKGDAQGFGSAATYARRYSLMAVCGVVGDADDDAEAAVGREAKGSTDPRGTAHKNEDHAEAQRMAEKFREGLKVGIDEAVYDLHTQCVDRADFYIAVSAFLSAGERREIKEIINRCREAMPKTLANGRAAPAAR